MSGNPFRASPSQISSSTAPPAPPVSFIDVDNNSIDGTAREFSSDPPAPTKTKKTVRIESPSSSPPQAAFHDADETLSQRISWGKHAGSPPPVSPAGFSDNFEDQFPAVPFYKDSGENALEERGGSRHSDMAGSLQSSSGAPVNPFSRTLATMEPQEKGSAELGQSAGQRKGRPAAEKPTKGAPKANLDVEGFKRLLMTGISSPSSSAPQTATPSTAAAPTVFESSSSTDTSSISRQSIDPVSETHVETPRTSYEMASSDDETVGLVTEVKKVEKKKPPPAPKHRHGKLVTSRTPQTVSFSEFAATEATSSPLPRKRTDSDLNKPLPPTPSILSPPADIVSEPTSLDARPPLESRPSGSSGNSGQSETPSTQKRAPPPVPLARRQSQLRASTASNRSRSNSNLTLSSQHSVEHPLSPGSSLEQNPLSSQKVAPPPPPRRHHGASLSTKTPPNVALSSSDSQSAAPRQEVISSPPTAPSSRRTTFSSPPPSPSSGQAGLARTSSVSSSRNNSRAVSNESATMPPPPPPPRRRQSGRTSLDKERPMYPSSSPTGSRRTSLENKRSSLDGRRTSVASESSLRYEYAPASENESVLYSPSEEKDQPRNISLEPITITESNSSNILDDMAKFQREIDELRERYKQ